LKGMPHAAAADAAREAVSRARAKGSRPTLDAIALEAAQLAGAAIQRSCRPLVNCSGTILNTGLGRAKLSPSAVEAVRDAAGSVALEINLETGDRGDRQRPLQPVLNKLTGCESALVVNNNAAAVFLTLNTFCANKSVLLSRGQSVEIGGSFRMPDVIRSAGAALIDVGCTNKTYVDDYENAITEHTAAYVRCHPSNFRIQGFTHEPTAFDLAQSAHRHHLLLIDDVGSGCLINTEMFGLPHEPTIADSLKAGADIVTASGDKLLGGPQAGIICGAKKLIERIAKNPLARALRIDKLTAAALEATLLDYVRGDLMQIPTLRYLARSTAEIEQLANRVCRELQDTQPKPHVTPGVCEPGGGALPGVQLPSWRVSFAAADADGFARKMRLAGVIGYISQSQFHLDMRTVDEPDIERIVQAARA